jgi:hypothetical protein
MKKYKYIGTEEQLKENVYVIEGKTIIYAFKDTNAIDLKNHKIELFILRDTDEEEEKRKINIIQFNYIPQNKYIDITPYIQDLITLGLVVEI